MTPDDDRCPYCDCRISPAEEAEGYCPRCENALPPDAEPDDEPIRGKLWDAEGLDDMGGVDVDEL